MLRRFAISFLLVLVGTCAWGRTRPHYGGTLRVEVEGDPWNGTEGLTRRLVYDGLTKLGADGAVRPTLAVEWKAEDENHRWQFRLRPRVHFHDGTLLTSAAVVASLNVSCSTNCPWTAVHAVGSLVVFTSDSPMPNLPALLAGDAFLIALVRTEVGPTPSGAIGTGPFQLVAFNSGILTLAANDNYWQGRPFLDEIALTVHRSIREQWLDLSVGRADVVEVPSEVLREARQQQLTVVTSPPVSLLALEIPDSGALANPALRKAIALAVDRGSLFNVIFQKQGEITASLLPQALTGYSFLFPTDRDLNKSHEARGGLAAPALWLGVDGGGAMQLAAQRIALNLHEAGFNVQVTGTGSGQHADMMLRKLPIGGGDAAAQMEALLRGAGQSVPVTERAPAALFQAEREFLNLNTLVPLLDLPRAYAIGGRVRDLQLRADGTPDLAGISLEGTP